MKKLLVLFALICALVALAGCGDENITADTTVESTQTTDTSAQTNNTTETSATGTGGSTTDTSDPQEGEVEDTVCDHVCGEWEYVVEPTCVMKGSQRTACVLCGEKIVAEAPATGHTPVRVEGREPSCSLEGLSEGEECATCGRPLVEQKTIDKLPHTEEIIKGLAPTCTANGLSDGKRCTVCGKTTVLQVELEPAGHDFLYDYCKVCKAVDPSAKPESDQNITIATNGESDYIVVYDDKNVHATEFAEKFIAYMKENHRITFESVPYSLGTQSEHCIYIGDLPQVERTKAKLNSYNDFGACVSGDDYVLYATDGRLYEYLFELLTEKVLYVLRGGNWNTSASRNFIYHSSDYKDKSYVDFVIERSGGKLTQDVLLKFFEARTYVAKDGTELKYRLYVPYGYDSTKEYPVVVFMHGAGERGNDNLGNMRQLPLKWFSMENSPFWNTIVIAPQCPNGQQWVDTPWADGGYRLENVPESNEMKAAIEIIDMVEASYPTDLDRYYVTGLSMGGFATWDMIMRYPDRFAAAVPLCGGADYKQAYKLIDMPIYTVHGTKDYDVPMSGTKEMVVALEMLGSTVINYEELKGYAHNVWGYAGDKAEIWLWMFEQTREGR